jgi:hypothetical protein
MLAIPTGDGYPSNVSERTRAELILAAHTMAIDQMTGEVVTAFRRECIDTILIKGPAIAQWLYPAGGRVYGDTDLLVSPRDFSRATHVLEALGFGEPIRGRVAHAHTYRRKDVLAGLEFCVDLHRSLPYITAAPAEVWRVMSDQTEQMAVGGLDVSVPGIPQRLLHIAIHSAQHAFESGKPLEDMRRAIEVATVEQWEAAVEQSRILGAEDALAGGLCLIPEGQILADRLGLTTRRRGMLRFAANPETETAAYQVQRVVDAASFGEKLKLIVDGITLSPVVMRKMSPLARRGRLGLFVAYAYRPLQLMGRLGPALVARKRIVKSP